MATIDGWLQAAWFAAGRHLWESTLVLALLFVLGALLRSAPGRLQYAFWSAALAKVFLPLAWLGWLGDRLVRLVGAAGARGDAAGAPGPFRTLDRVLDPFSITVSPSPEAGAAPVYVALTVLWAAGAGWILWRGLKDLGAHGGGTAVSSARPEIRSRVGSALAGTRIPEERVLVVAAGIMPAVAGLLSSRILLPERAVVALRTEQLRAVLLHEDAHRRRRDPLLGLAHRVALSVFFFYPPLWMILRRLKEAAEFACDESALRAGVPAEVHAAALARTLHLGLEGSRAQAAIPPGRPAILRERFLRLEEAARYAVLSKHRLALSGALIILTLSVVYPLSFREGNHDGRPPGPMEAGIVAGLAGTGDAGGESRHHEASRATGGVGAPGAVADGQTADAGPGSIARVAEGEIEGVNEGVQGGVAGTVRGGVTGGVAGGVSGRVTGGVRGRAAGTVGGGVTGGVAGGVEGGVAGSVREGVAGGVPGGVSGRVRGDVRGSVAGTVRGGVTGGVAGGVEGGVAGGVEGGVAGGVKGGVPGGVAGTVAGRVAGSVRGEAAGRVGEVVEGVVTGAVERSAPGAGGSEGGAPVLVEGDVEPPELIDKVQPIYPAEARAARIEGTVVLEAIIDTAGSVEDVKVLRSVPALDEAAIAAVRQWTYKPALRNGVPVKVFFTIVVKFTLQAKDVEPREPLVVEKTEVQPPLLLAKVEPEYPRDAREARAEGKVSLEAVVGADGAVEEVKVLQGVDGFPSLADEAAKAVRQWRYQPAMQQGRPVKVAFRVAVDFSLDSKEENLGFDELNRLEDPQRPVGLVFRGESIARLFDTLSRAWGLEIQLRGSVPAGVKVTVDSQGVSLKGALEFLARTYRLRYEVPDSRTLVVMGRP